MATKEVRPIRIEGNIAYVPLTKGYTAVIDAADVPLVAGHNWAALVTFKRDGTVRSVYAWRNTPRADGPRKPIYLHRVLLGLDDGLQGDHRDGDGLNNRRKNLRPATRAENQRNCRMSVLNTSGVKGVYWCRVRKKWVAQIRTNNIVKNLGSFEDIKMAQTAYISASISAHGAFGRA